MSEKKNYTCIGCPVGCPLQLTHEGQDIIEIEGHACNRGAKYARQEFSDPRRGFSTTVVIRGARYPRLPVRVSQPIPKDRVLEAATLIQKLEVEAPVRRGQVILKGLFGDEQIQVIACRTLERVAP